MLDLNFIYISPIDLDFARNTCLEAADDEKSVTLEVKSLQETRAKGKVTISLCM